MFFPIPSQTSDSGERPPYNPGLGELLNYYALVICGTAVALYTLYSVGRMAAALDDVAHAADGSGARETASVSVSMAIFTIAALFMLRIVWHFVKSIRRAHAARALHRS